MAAQAFQDEINRIVNSPWPTQLKQLHELAKTADVPSWAAQHPHQVSHLAKLVVDARFTWPYTYDIIADFSVEPALRDAFLQHAPQLLHELLTGKRDVSTTAALVALLSSPLPLDVALPTEVQQFFLDIVDRAACNPHLDTIKTLHTILTGACGSLVGLLSSKIIEDVGRKLCAIVDSFSSADGNCSILYALSCVYTLWTRLQQSGTYPRLSYYFTGSKAIKSVNLLALKVLWATRIETDDETAQQTYPLADRVLPGLPIAARVEWCQRNPEIVRKLEEKIISIAKPGRRIRAIHFLASLIAPARISAPVVASLTPISAHVDGLLVLHQSSTPDQLAQLLPMLDQESITTIISTTVSCLDESVQFGAVEALNCIMMVCNQVLAADKLDHRGIATAMTEERLRVIERQPERLQLELHAQQDPQSCLARLRLSQQACQVFLHIAPGDHRKELLATLNKLCTLPEQVLQQRQSESRPAAPTHMVPTSWQTSIEAHMQHKHQTDQAEIEHIFRLYCGDLEARCANVEQPLHDERALTAQLRQQIAELQSIESQHQETILHLEQRLEKTCKSNASMSAQLESMLVDKEALQKDFNHAKQEHARVVAEHLDKITMLTAQNSAAQLQANMQQVQSQAQIEDLSRQMSMCQKAVETCKQECALQQNHIDRLKNEGETARHELDQSHAKHQDDVARLRQAQQRLADLVNQAQTLEQQLASQTTAYAADLAQSRLEMAEHIDQQRQELTEQSDAQLAKINEANREMTDQLSAELQTMQATHQELEATHKKVRKQAQDQAHKLELLRHACQDKDKEIAKLRGIRDNMMAAMGLPPVQVDDDSTIADLQSLGGPNTQPSLAVVSSRRQTAQQQPRHLRRATSDNISIPTPRSPLGSLSANTSPAKRAHRGATVHKIVEEDFDLHAFDEDDLMTSTS